jgi:hypothetical protein
MPEVERRTTYEQLTSVLERHVSRITAMSVLASVLAQCSLAPHDVRGHNIVDVVEKLMVGLRLFCDPTRLPDLMIELAELCDRETLFLEGEPSKRPAALLQRTQAAD